MNGDIGDMGSRPSESADIEAALQSLPDKGGTGGFPPERLSWDDYSAGSTIFRNLLDIRGFTLLLDLSPLPEIVNRELTSNLSTAMYGIALKAIQEARFFQEDTLSLQVDSGAARVIYRDDRFDFILQVVNSPEDDRQTQLALTRTGSRFADFHDWYVALAPQFTELVTGVLQQLRDMTGRSVEVFRGAYQFRFLLHDLRAGDSQSRIRNSDVMKKLIRGVPDDNGLLSESDDVIGSVGRIDVNLSRWKRIENSWALERYNVEAPANKEGAGLWLQFSHGGETYSLGDQRERFDLSSFLDQTGHAYVDFLRDKALNRFLLNLLADNSFRSSPDVLP